MADHDKDPDELSAGGAFELEDDLLEEPGPPPKPQPDLSPPPAPNIELEDDAEPEPEPELQDVGEPPDGGTVRMSLSDVVSAWDEEAPSDGASEGSSDSEAVGKDRSGIKRSVIAVLVVVAVLALIVVLFAG